MHRREVALIAQVIRTQRDSFAVHLAATPINRVAIQATDCLAVELAAAFKSDQPSFRVDLFLAACGTPVH